MFELLKDQMFIGCLIFFTLLGCVTQNTVVNPIVKSIQGPLNQDVTGVLEPSIYYLPHYTDIDHKSCIDEVGQIDIKTIDNLLLVKSCQKVLKSCEMQGTCLLESHKKKYLVTIDKKNDDNERTFKIVENKICRYGSGSTVDKNKSYRAMCIDPFYSVAADLSIYNLGDVLFIPKLKGVVLPNKEKHSGYVIVRDSGKLVKGDHRFDFFTGFYGISKLNPFYKLGLSDGTQKLEYRLVEDKSEAERIRFLRKFPLIK